MKYPGATGYLRGLYTIEGAPEHLKDLFENKFMSIADGQAAESLRLMLEDHKIPSGQLRVAWARFIMSLLHRTPEGVTRGYTAIKRYYEENISEQDRERYAAERKQNDPETIEEYLRINSPRPNFLLSKL